MSKPDSARSLEHENGFQSGGILPVLRIGVVAGWQRSVGFPRFQQAEEQMPPTAATHSVLALNQNSLCWDRCHYRFLLCKV